MFDWNSFVFGMAATVVAEVVTVALFILYVTIQEISRRKKNVTVY